MAIGIPLVVNRGGKHAVSWPGITKAALLILAIGGSAGVGFSWLLFGTLPPAEAVMGSVMGLGLLLAGIVRQAFNTPVDQLPITR